MTSLLTDDVRAVVGQAVTYRAPEPLGAASIRYFAVAIGSDPERWLDEAPPTLVCETNQLTGLARPDANHYLGHVWAIPFPVPTVMIRGGNDYRFHRPARPDDRITTTWTVTDIVEHRDRSGAPLVVLTAEASYRSEADELIATNVETLIYRAAA